MKRIALVLGILLVFVLASCQTMSHGSDDMKDDDMMEAEMKDDDMKDDDMKDDDMDDDSMS